MEAQRNVLWRSRLEVRALQPEAHGWDSVGRRFAPRHDYPSLYDYVTPDPYIDPASVARTFENFLLREHQWREFGIPPAPLVRLSREEGRRVRALLPTVTDDEVRQTPANFRCSLFW